DADADAAPSPMQRTHGLDNVHDVVLDGAHNPHAARALVDELRRRQLRPIVIVAASSDKDVKGIAEALAPVARHLIATRYQQDRAMAPEALAAVFHDAIARTGSAEPPATNRDASNRDASNRDDAANSGSAEPFVAP